MSDQEYRQTVAQRLNNLDATLQVVLTDYDSDPAMWGLANGLLMAKGILYNEKVKLIDRPIKWKMTKTIKV